MAVLGHLYCRTCRQETCVGKWLRDDDNVGFGFWRGGESFSGLGLKVLNFLARHIDHDVLVVTDWKRDELSHTEPFEEYEDVEDMLREDWPADAG